MNTNIPVLELKLLISTYTDNTVQQVQQVIYTCQIFLF